MPLELLCVIVAMALALFGVLFPAFFEFVRSKDEGPRKIPWIEGVYSTHRVYRMRECTITRCRPVCAVCEEPIEKGMLTVSTKHYRNRRNFYHAGACYRTVYPYRKEFSISLIPRKRKAS